MPRDEIYPWSTLEKVGDYFLVTEDFERDVTYLSYIVSTRNRNYKGKIKYAVNKTSYGGIVMVIQVGDEMPETDTETVPGILALVAGKVREPAPRPVREVKLTQRQKIAKMTAEERLENLPWWYDSRTNKLVFNSRVATEEHVDLWMRKKFNPGPETPYPEEYHLNDDLRVKSREERMLEEKDEEEDEWAGYSATGEEAEDVVE